MKPTWHEKHVLQRCGYDEDQFTDDLILMARQGLELCYYEDQAARWLLNELWWIKRKQWHAAYGY